MDFALSQGSLDREVGEENMRLGSLWILGFWLFLLGPLLAEPVGIQSLFQQKKLSMQLVGDGTTTSKVLLRLTNLTSSPLTVSIPLGQAFLPENPSKNQFMVTTEPRTVEIPPGQTVEVPELPTMCASPKSVPPPGSGSTYTPGDFPDPQRHQEFLGAISVSRELEQSGEFDKVPIPRERRLSTVLQLSVWMMEGERTGKPEDQITERTIANELLTSAGVEYESLPPKEQEKFDDGVSKIFAAADLTKKKVKERPEGELIDDKRPQVAEWQFVHALVIWDKTDKILRDALNKFLDAAGAAVQEFKFLQEAIERVGPVKKTPDMVILIYHKVSSEGKVLERHFVEITQEKNRQSYGKPGLLDPKNQERLKRKYLSMVKARGRGADRTDAKD